MKTEVAAAKSSSTSLRNASLPLLAGVLALGSLSAPAVGGNQDASAQGGGATNRWLESERAEIDRKLKMKRLADEFLQGLKTDPSPGLRVLSSDPELSALPRDFLDKNCPNFRPKHVVVIGPEFRSYASLGEIERVWKPEGKKPWPVEDFVVIDLSRGGKSDAYISSGDLKGLIHFESSNSSRYGSSDLLSDLRQLEGGVKSFIQSGTIARVATWSCFSFIGGGALLFALAYLMKGPNKQVPIYGQYWDGDRFRGTITGYRGE